MNLEIGNVYALILIPIIFAFMYSTFKKHKPASKNDWVILISRIIIFTLLVGAFTNISLNFKGRNVSTVFILDVSESMGDFKESGELFINNALKEIPKGNKSGVVIFGDNSKIDKVLNKKKEYKSINENPVVSATNIQEAVESSLALFKKGTSKRIVLITDGEENQGDILKAIPLINEQNIDFKINKVTTKAGDEVYVDNVKVPDNISVGEEFSVQIDLQSNYAAKAKLILFSGRDKVGEQDVQIQKGKNAFVFKDKQTSGGFKGYRVLVEAEGDTSKINNEFSAFTNVVDKPTILLINGKLGESEALEKILSEAGATVKKIGSKSAPMKLNEFLEYKTIILNNVHKDDLNNGFMDNVETYVKDYGGGLVSFGGEEAYALGGYKDTTLEKVLPVNMDKTGKNEVPGISLNLIIDKSGSMGGEAGGVSKLTLAKEAAMKALENLREVDEISLIAFDDTFEEVVQLQKVGDKNAIKEKIAGIQIRGGTSIYPALDAGYNIQKESNAKIKHTILLTDGEDGMPYATYAELLAGFNSNNITLSTVAVGEGANQTLLGDLATVGKGRSYYTDMYTDIPRIFAKEVLLSAGTYIINEEFTPSILSNHEILSGVKTSKGIPSLLGYIGTSIKEDAIEILRSNHDEPILAARQYGLGKTVSWTSDISGQWSRNYLTWEYGAQLVKNMIFYTIPQYGEEGRLSVTQEGNEAKVEFYNDKISKDAKVKGLYNGENDKKGDFELTQTQPGKFEANIPLEDLGFYNFSIREEEEGTVKNNYKGGFALQYSQEFKFNNNVQKLDTVVKETKGSFINKPEEVFTGDLEKEYNKINTVTPLLVISIILFMLDIAYRRLNLDFSKYFRNRKKNKSKVYKEKTKKKSMNKEASINEDLKIKTEEAIDLEVNEHTPRKNNKKHKKQDNNVTIDSEKIEKKETLNTGMLLKKKSDRKKI
ncbi:VWA domain-containing protein [Clostridium gasigenes]|uniref:VWA domain-containing protein n=1 Tax=Clostridium gasigenes TaxID=94869 RepID=UPI001C0BE743|nr:VWA domain-containing protein [Clostridium gasigenes]MBU3106415.1 VWA domain-containing protein [Clostridium gasigenes]